MSQVLTLKRDKQGVPKRLHLKCDYAEKDTAQRAGLGTGVWAGGSKTWTYPVDPVVVGQLMQHFSKLSIDEGVWDYLDELSTRQEAILTATQDQRPLTDQPLWGFQRATVRFAEVARRCIIGHQMGTGKTPISCTATDYLGLSKILVVCPNSVKWAWTDFMLEWGRRTDLYVMESGSARADERAEIICGVSLSRDTALAKLLTNQPTCVLVLNYDQMRLHQDTLSAFDWDVIIPDEAHRLNNRKSLRSEAMAKIAANASYLWLLTGTPVRNDYSDLYNLLALCDPIRFSSYWNFVKLHLQYVPNYHGGIDIIGLRDEDAFNAMLSTYMFRVTKAEAMPELPPLLYNDIRTPLGSKQREIYEQMEKDFIMFVEKEVDNGGVLQHVLSAPNVISQITRLRQICLTPAIVGGAAESAKLDVLPDLIEDILAEGKPFLIFTCFRAFLPYVETVLKKMKIPYGEIVGGQSAQARSEVVRQLNSGSILCIAGTTQSMGEGLNLQTASTAIFCDEDWVPAVNSQAAERIHRGEIKESPTILRLYHPDTVEADIRAACRKKERIISETAGRVEVVRQMLLRRR